MLVLKTLSWGAMHGFGIASWLEQYTEGELAVDDSALYQALHRLEGRGFVDAEWGVSENNRKVRYYRLTAGWQRLKGETATWLRYTRTVTGILTLAARPA